MPELPRVREADEIVQDYLPVPIDVAFKKGHLVSTRTACLAVTQALKEAHENIGPSNYIQGYTDGYAAALEEIKKQADILLKSTDSL